MREAESCLSLLSIWITGCCHSGNNKPISLLQLRVTQHMHFYTHCTEFVSHSALRLTKSSLFSLVTCFSFPECASVIPKCVRIFCMCLWRCVSVLTNTDKHFPVKRSPDTQKQQVKSILWHLLVAAGLFVGPDWSWGPLCGSVCALRQNRGRGNQSGLVWSFVFIDKCVGQSRRAIEKFVFLWSSVGGCGTYSFTMPRKQEQM